MTGQREVELGLYIKALLKYWKHMLVFFLISICCSAIAAYLILTPTYEAKSTFILTIGGQEGSYVIDPNRLLVSQEMLKDFLSLIKSPIVIQSAVEKLDLHTPLEELEKKISIELLNDTRIIDLRVQHTDPDSAKNINRAIIEASSEKLGKVMKNLDIQIIDEERISYRSIQIQLVFITIMVGTLTILLFMFAIFLKEYFNKTLSTLEEFEKILNTPVIGMIPKPELKNKALYADTNTTTASLYRLLYIDLCQSTLRKNVKFLGVTSFIHESNKEAFIYNLGLQLRQTNKKILIVDADERNPVLHEYFKLSNNKGFIDIMSDDGQYGEFIRESKLGISILTIGTFDSKMLHTVSEDKLHRFIERAGEKYDMVLFNLPALAADVDAPIIAMQLESILIVSNLGTVNAASAKRVVEFMRRAKTNILGVVIEKKSKKMPQNYFELVQ